MHICDLKELKTLNLSSNCLHNLPPQIAAFTNLNSLDLHHNLLVGLPLEFSELLDEVEEINVTQNPMSTLPDKWNVNWSSGPSSYQNPKGYTNGEIFEFVRDEALIYNSCSEEWREAGAMHYGNKLNFEEFLSGSTSSGHLGVKKRMGTINIEGVEHETYTSNTRELWHPRFMVNVKRFYFEAKRNGNPPVYNELAASVVVERKKMSEAGEAKREAQVKKVREDAMEYNARRNNAYDLDLTSKTRRAEGHKIERRKRKVLVQECTTEELIDQVSRRIEIQDERRLDIQVARNENARSEMNRLQTYVRKKLVLDSKNADNDPTNPDNEDHKRTMPIHTVPCWKSKPISNESVPDSRPNALSFKAKFSKKERNYQPPASNGAGGGGGGKRHGDKKALRQLNSSKKLEELERQYGN
jgi:hypothetical protein